MNLTILALMNLASVTCTAHYGSGLSSLNWYRNQCVTSLETCFNASVTEADVKTCIAKSNAEKVCDASGGQCF